MHSPGLGGVVEGEELGVGVEVFGPEPRPEHDAGSLASGRQAWLATRRRAAPDTRQEDVEGVEVLEAHRDPALRFYSTLAAFPSAMAIKD